MLDRWTLSASLFLQAVAIAVAAPLQPVPFKVPPAVEDKQDFQVPDRVQLAGWIGTRLSGNETNRLLKMDVAHILDAYHKRPGGGNWDGEYIGKWIDAATLAWVNSGDPALRAKLDATVAELIKCQSPDGYLGTYPDKERWSGWDVWSHEYNLIGLITYYRYTGNPDALAACRSMADLLCHTFGDTSGQRDIIASGPHVGMASSSVLEPMCLLYRLTGDTKYLDFCKYLVRSWEQPDGPHIVSTLLSGKGVNQVADAKAYEMLFCLNGALEYYRTTGDPKILQAVQNAWQDIVDHRLYITGSASAGESFQVDFNLPNTGNIQETCVTVTWIQLNAQLLRLTGEARFAQQLERSVLNQLFGAETPNGALWGYYVELEGPKPYNKPSYFCCCSFSGPRGVALIPTFAVSTDADGAVVNFYESGKASLKLRDGTDVTLVTDSQYPADGHVGITVNPAAKKEFTVKLRIPAWCQKPSITIAGQTVVPQASPDGYSAIKRTWTAGDRIDLDLPMALRVVAGDHLNHAKAALMYGPLVLAADAALFDDKAQDIKLTTLASADADALGCVVQPATDAYKTWPGAHLFQVNTLIRKTTPSHKAGTSDAVRLVPFADAGLTGAAYQVWLPVKHPPRDNLLADGVESSSRRGNVGSSASIGDDDPSTFTVTFDGTSAVEDWYAISVPEPVQIRRVVFLHGSNFHDGGWFDAHAGKPKVQVQAVENGPWKTIGELTDYPATTATDNARLQPGQPFTLKLDQPVTAVAVRVIGTPATGDAPQQAFSSCAELQAFAQ